MAGPCCNIQIIIALVSKGTIQAMVDKFLTEHIIKNMI